MVFYSAQNIFKSYHSETWHTSNHVFPAFHQFLKNMHVLRKTCSKNYLLLSQISKCIKVPIRKFKTHTKKDRERKKYLCKKFSTIFKILKLPNLFWNKFQQAWKCLNTEGQSATSVNNFKILLANQILTSINT